MTRPALFRSLLRRFRRDDGGLAALEFALIVPIFSVVLAATVDFGLELYLREQLNDSVSAAANFAQVNASDVSASGGAALATKLANLVANTHGPNWATGSATVNAGPSYTSSGVTGGSAAPANSCYCPTGTATALSWGGAQTCGSVCPSGVVAGKFVLISASLPYSPMFPRAGVTQSGQLTSASLVQVK